MIRASDFQLYSVQAAAFTPEQNRFRNSRVLASVVPDFADRYDGDIQSASPQQFEVAGASSAVGIRLVRSVSLVSEDGRWRFEATPERVDSFWQSTVEARGTDLAEICRQCIEPIMRYPLEVGLQVGRLALVVRRWSGQGDEDGLAGTLAGMFCQPELVDDQNPAAPLRHSRGFQLHNLKKYESALPGIHVNSWVRCRSNVMIHDTPAVSIEQDINTLGEELARRAFTPQDSRQFFEWAPAEMDRILDLYFPSND